MRRYRSPAPLLIVLAAVGLAACSGAAVPAPSATPATRAAAPPAPPSAATTAPSPSVLIGGAPEAWLAVGRTGADGVHVILAASGEEIMSMPAGSPAARWSRVATATPDGSATVVATPAVQPGPPTGPELRIDGRWALPAIGEDPIPSGTSTDGSTIVLVEAAPSPGVSRFAVVQHVVAGAVTGVGDAPLQLARIVTLRGTFDYDTLSPDGRILYVVQHLDEATGRYQVRAVDIPSGVMREGVIADKRNLGEAMAGWPIGQLRRDDGTVLTLYRGDEHPFIHALNSTDAWAVCIDLPADGNADRTAALDWGIAATPDGRAVYAVNATLGLAVDVDPDQLTVRRTAVISATAAAPAAAAGRPGIVLAKFGHGEVGTVGRRVVVSADGRTLFAGGPDGIVTVDAGRLTVTRHDLAGVAVDALGLLPDGSVLFALRHDGRIEALDPATGRSLGFVPGDGYDQLFAVAPL